MQIQVPHIQQRGRSYFFRIRIPLDLQPRFDGKREVVKPLGTTDPSIAVVKASELTNWYKRKFQVLRTGRLDHFGSLNPVQDGVTISETSVPLLSEVLEEMNLARSTKIRTTQSS